jgi:hypothetical protein
MNARVIEDLEKLGFDYNKLKDNSELAGQLLTLCGKVRLAPKFEDYQDEIYITVWIQNPNSPTEAKIDKIHATYMRSNPMIEFETDLASCTFKAIDGDLPNIKKIQIHLETLWKAYKISMQSTQHLDGNSKSNRIGK